MIRTARDEKYAIPVRITFDSERAIEEILEGTINTIKEEKKLGLEAKVFAITVEMECGRNVAHTRKVILKHP